MLLGCSSDDENHSNQLTQKLVGSWKMVGYYDHEYDEQTGSINYFYNTVENDGMITKFKENKSFEVIVNSSIYEYGTYTVSKDSVLTMKYNNSDMIGNEELVYRITFSNNSKLEMSFANAAGFVYERTND